MIPRICDKLFWFSKNLLFQELWIRITEGLVRNFLDDGSIVSRRFEELTLFLQALIQLIQLYLPFTFQPSSGTGPSFGIRHSEYTAPVLFCANWLVVEVFLPSYWLKVIFFAIWLVENFFLQIFCQLIGWLVRVIRLVRRWHVMELCFHGAFIVCFLVWLIINTKLYPLLMKW